MSCKVEEDQALRILRRSAVAFCAASIGRKVASAKTAKTSESGKTALITGASTGIGKATAAELAQSGQYSRIFLAGHNEAKTRQAMKDLRAEVQLDYLPLELASLESVRQAAKTFQDSQLPLHTLICNAAVMAIPERQTTKDGFELQFEVNYLSHFLLVNLLIPQLASAGTKEDPARIISVSSSAHFVRSPLAFGDTDALNLEDSSGPRAYYPWTAYGQSKLAQVIFTYELARRLAERQLPVVANVLDPGIVDTELQRYLPTPAPTAVMRFAKSPKQGAETSVMLALEKTKTSGGYWVDGKKAESLGRGPPPLPFNKELGVEGSTSYDTKTWASLWRQSAELVGIQTPI
ncbi:unnamed protein product [Durusdinium trenchii]